MKTDPTAEIDSRFSDPAAKPTPWSDAAHVLKRAELYWLSTVRTDGRPHVTPLITGNNTWAQGLDVVVEGTAVPVADRDALQRLADAYEAKYGSAWHFDVGDGVFGTGQDAAAVFRIEPAKVLAFAKKPHAQTRGRSPPAIGPTAILDSTCRYRGSVGLTPTRSAISSHFQ